VTVLSDTDLIIDAAFATTRDHMAKPP